jgi:hypothetical protein
VALLVGSDALLRGAGLGLVDRAAQPRALALAGEQDRDVVPDRGRRCGLDRLDKVRELSPISRGFRG